MLLIFVNNNIEIVGKSNYNNGLQSLFSIKSEFLYSYLLFPFLAGTSRTTILKNTW